MNVQLADYIHNSLVNGTGIRDTIFLSGCTHNCTGCQNELAQKFDFGESVTAEYLIEKILKSHNEGIIDGITFTGGDPLCQYEATLHMCRELKKNNVGIWIFTGYSYNSLVIYGMDEITKYIDVLVDGAFLIEKLDNSPLPRGSTNQNIISFDNGIIDTGKTIWGNK